MSRILASIVVFISLTSAVLAEEPTLTVYTLNEKIVFTLSKLLARKDLESIHLPTDPAYHKAMTYTAIKMTNLFANLKITKDQVLQFKALDGFSAPISLDHLLNTDEHSSVAYLAIETKQGSWPPLKAGSPASAGPFFLIWKNPQALQISKEEWPFQLVSFEVLDSLEKTYPDIFPDSKLANASAVKKGFQVFRTNCFTCHTMNKNGSSKLGPDLNVPMNPTEYFKDGVLKNYIRDPQAIRYWPEAKMAGFSRETISEQELDDLVSYLKHMVTRKKQ